MSQKQAKQDIAFLSSLQLCKSNFFVFKGFSQESFETRSPNQGASDSNRQKIVLSGKLVCSQLAVRHRLL
jgi:hypothetical protein